VTICSVTTGVEGTGVVCCAVVVVGGVLTSGAVVTGAALLVVVFVATVAVPVDLVVFAGDVTVVVLLAAGLVVFITAGALF
jgi:hypothetical protein